MASRASIGQTLTPSQNVAAPAGQGGDIWGANGGSAVAVGGGVTDQTGFAKPILSTLSNGEAAANYIAPAQITQRPGSPSILSRMSNATLNNPNGVAPGPVFPTNNFIPGTELDLFIGGGGSNLG